MNFSKKYLAKSNFLPIFEMQILDLPEIIVANFSILNLACTVY